MHDIVDIAMLLVLKMTSDEVLLHVVKMKGLPPNVREAQIEEFFKPLSTKVIKIPRNAKGKNTFSKLYMHHIKCH